MGARARNPSAEDLREKILEEAIGIVYEEGAERITMRALAERLDYSPATIYLYFQNKEELLVEIARHGFARLAEHILPAASVDDPAEGLRRMAHGFLDFAFENPALYQLMSRVLPPTGADPGAPPGARSISEASVRFHARGRQAGALRDLDHDVLEALFTSALHGFVDLALTGRMPRRPDKDLPALREAFVEALVAALSEGR